MVDGWKAIAETAVVALVAVAAGLVDQSVPSNRCWPTDQKPLKQMDMMDSRNKYVTVAESILVAYKKEPLALPGAKDPAERAIGYQRTLADSETLNLAYLRLMAFDPLQIAYEAGGPLAHRSKCS